MKKKRNGKRTKMPTTFSSKCEILADLWLNYREDENFTDFVEYNDLGLPLAYLVFSNIAKIEEYGERFINETFDLLLAGLDIEDKGYETLEQVFEEAESK